VRMVRIMAAIIIAAVIGFAAVKKVSPLSWGFWGVTNSSSGVALGGFDPVSYFEAAAPIPGNQQHTHEWRDAVWQFSSEENRSQFADDPVRYAPQFGGFCSFAVSKGFTANANPHAWHIEDGSLYVFMDEHVRNEWVAEIETGSLRLSREQWSKR
jgi:hypothetical protein